MSEYDPGGKSQCWEDNAKKREMAHASIIRNLVKCQTSASAPSTGLLNAKVPRMCLPEGYSNTRERAMGFIQVVSGE